LWARERVAWLDDRMALEPSDSEPLRREIVRVALEHRIASRFTALVAVEERRATDGNRVTVVQPVELPDAWSRAFLEPPAAAAPMLSAGMIGSRDLSMLPAPRLCRDRIRPAVGGPEDKSMRSAERLEAAAASAAQPDAWLTQTPVTPVARSIETALATTQDADGAFEGSIERTAAALLALVRLGHTRSRGTRRRVVQKCARWLEQRTDRPLARLALDLLARAEAGGELPGRAEVGHLLGAGREGDCLARALDLA
jgi:hypothetical protein